MAPTLDPAPQFLSLDAETMLDLVPSKALVTKGPEKQPLIERVKIKSRRFLNPLLHTLGFKKLRRDQDPPDHSLDEIMRSLNSTPIALDSSCDATSGAPGNQRQSTNHTSGQYWIQSIDGQAIHGDPNHTLEADLQSRLHWANPVIAPAYRFRNCSEHEGLVSALPSSLMIKPAKAYLKNTRKLDKLLATQFGLIYQPEISRYLAGLRYYLVDIASRRQFPTYAAYQILQKLREEEYRQFVDVVELDIIPHCVPTASGAPLNDPYYKDQWNLSWIHAEEGWAQAGWHIGDPSFEPGKGVIVAVIDSGVDLDHPDFESRTALVPGATFQPGAEFDYSAGEGPIEIDDDPETGGAVGEDPHGTMCAGVIGARCNNSKGIAGLAGACKVMPIRIIGYYKSVVAAAINYAANHGAHVISMSFGGDRRNGDYLKGAAMDTAIDYAFTNKKVVLCAATMNRGESLLYYPAAHPNVLACGASAHDAISRSHGEWDPLLVGPGSNYGEGLDVLAPGTNISSTLMTNRNPNDSYTAKFCGTSSATPQVASLAALLISAYPTKLQKNPAEVYRIIRESARAATGTSKPAPEVGYGCIDVLAAFITAKETYGPPTWSI
jgi:hypothetical protein